MAQRLTYPDFPTFIKKRYENGVVRGRDNKVTLIKKVPMEAIFEAKTTEDRQRAFGPLMNAFKELADLPSYRGTRRQMNRSHYRQFHLLFANVPGTYSAPLDHPNREYLNRNYEGTPVDQRTLLLSVPLIPRIGGTQDSLSAKMGSVIHQAVYAEDAIEDFTRDTNLVDQALTRAGLVSAKKSDLRLANAYWNFGKFADTPILAHGDHIHFFSTATAASQADRMGGDDCATWMDTIPNTSALSFLSCEDLELGFAPSDSDFANWMYALVTNEARAVSVRGFIEPAKITADELRRRRRRIQNDIKERHDNNKMERYDQQEEEQTLGEIMSLYETGGGTPTIVDASIVAAFDGVIDDVAGFMPDSPFKANMMSFRQPAAWEETKLASFVRANPNLLDLPSQVIGCSGIQSLSVVGDRTGALVGFSETDRQPSYLSAVAASSEDEKPLCLVAGATGSGKTMLLLSLATQMAQETSNIVIDLKQDSDHSAIIAANGGIVISLDDLNGKSGILDPIRFSRDATAGVSMAVDALALARLWPNTSQMERPFKSALQYGIRQGATSIGGALQYAYRDKQASADMVDPVFTAARDDGFMRAIIGFEDSDLSLATTNRLTYIKLGETFLALPPAGANLETLSSEQRNTLALVQMLVYGSASALNSHGGGVIHLDEAWIFLKAGYSEVERLGRLARSWNVLPILYTQKLEEAEDAKLEEFISRGLILPLGKKEAFRACKMFDLEPTAERIARITAKKKISDSSNSPNFNSLFALYETDEETGARGKLLRGSVAIYSDLSGKAIPVEVTLSDEFLATATTTPEARRKREEATRKASEQRVRAGVSADSEFEASGLF